MSRLSLQIQVDPDAGDLPADRRQIRRWVAAALSADAELVLRFVGSDGGPRAQPAVPRPRPAHQRPDLRLRARRRWCSADIVICLPVAARGGSCRSTSRSAITWRTWWCTACCTPRGTTMRTTTKPQRMEATRDGDPRALRHRRPVCLKPAARTRGLTAGWQPLVLAAALGLLHAATFAPWGSWWAQLARADRLRCARRSRMIRIGAAVGGSSR